ncbi:MAG: ATP-dependent helicase [Cyclobacteriaceae bacterium]|nr:ATP-dependent helicase [Cyclobacteriaceae bacterium]
MFDMILSEAQTLIVYSPYNRAIQVLASAGSGKTRVLTERVRYILNSTKKDGVIALTFTNKAAEEMQSRLSDSEDAEERTWVATIHSVAQRILEQYGHTIGLPSDLQIYDRDKDRMEVFLQSLREDGVDIDQYLNVADSKELRNKQQILQGYMDGFSLIKRELLNEDDVASRFPNNPKIWKVFQDYQRALISGGGIDYEDILVYAHEILCKHDWTAKIYRAKYKHICVDEAQDLNKAQYEFIKSICGESLKSILMVGDPNQMIYGFNGSSIEYFCTEFVKDFSPLQFKLIENFRSTKAVIRVANKLKPLSQKESEFAFEGEVDIKSFENETSESEWIAGKIENLIKLNIHKDIEGTISLEKMVVIARNRFVFMTFEKVLKQRKIAYSLRKGERASEPASLFGKVLDYAMRIKLNPKDWVDSKKLCALLKLTLPPNSEVDLLNYLSVKMLKSTLPKSELYSSVLDAVNNLDLSRPNIPKIVRDFKQKLELLASQIVQSNEVSEEDEELKRSLDELDEFNSFWTKFKRKGLGDSLLAFRNALSLGQLSEDLNNGGLTLSTVHTMKGLEKDIVFLMGMCEGVFPDYRAKTNKEIDEERNSAFVAVTRAKRWLYISYPKQRVMPWGDARFQHQSQFITEIQS